MAPTKIKLKLKPKHKDSNGLKPDDDIIKHIIES